MKCCGRTFGRGGVVAVAVCFWIAFGLMLAAALTPDWSTISSQSNGNSFAFARIGAFESCAFDITTNSWVCQYIPASNFEPSVNDVCTQQEQQSVNSCNQAMIALFVVRISLVVFIVVQFIGALMTSLVPCFKNSNVITYRKSKMVAGFAELFQIVVISLWYVYYQHLQNLDSYTNQLNASNNINTPTLASTQQTILNQSWYLAVASFLFPIVASLIDCCTEYYPHIQEQRQNDMQGIMMTAGGNDNYMLNDANLYSSPLAEGPNSNQSQRLVYAV